jgi:hypothetical protein
MSPTACSDVSPWKINYVYKNSVLGKLGLMKVIAVKSSTDSGSTKAGLSCDVKTITNQGDMDFTVTTETVNGEVYTKVVPQF